MNIHNKKLVNSKSYIKNINHANETHPKTKHSNDKKKKTMRAKNLMQDYKYVSKIKSKLKQMKKNYT